MNPSVLHSKELSTERPQGILVREQSQKIDTGFTGKKIHSVMNGYTLSEQKMNVDTYISRDFAFMKIHSKNVSWKEIAVDIERVRQEYPMALCLTPGKLIAREEALETLPEKVMLMDGVGTGASWTNAARKMASRAHHGVDCAQDQATCELVHNDFSNGVLAQYQNLQGQREGTAIVHHIDQDNMLAFWLFAKTKLIREKADPALLKKLVTLEGLVDRSGGFCDLADEDAEEMKWVFEPFYAARNSENWLIEQESTDRIAGIVNDCFDRFIAYATGKANRKKLQLDYDVIGDGPGFKTVVQHGSDSRMKMYRDAKIDGTGAYVVALPYKKVIEDGVEVRRPIYTIKILKGYGAFRDLPWITDRLNRMESLPFEVQQQFSLEIQYETAKKLEVVKPHFGGHEDLLANHRNGGSQRGAPEMTEMLSFLQYKYAMERK